MPLGLTAPVKPIRILLLSDIHGNYPALLAIDREVDAPSFDYIVNCGDSLVYAPFPNETLRWLKRHNAISILGNTDKKVINLLKGQQFAKPRKPEKRIMYSSTAEALDAEERHLLLSFAASETLILQQLPKRTHQINRSASVFSMAARPIPMNSYLPIPRTTASMNLPRRLELSDCRHRPLAQSVS